MTATGSAASGDFEKYTADVYGWAYRLLGRHHDALDVVQDVFLRWDAQCAQHPPDQPRPWLRRVTLNRAIDLRRQRRPAAPIEEVPQPVATDDSIARSLDREDLRDRIATALDSLSEGQRLVLVAKVYDEMTFAAMADEMDLAVSTVKTHYLRAVRALRDKLHKGLSRE